MVFSDQSKILHPDCQSCLGNAKEVCKIGKTGIFFGTVFSVQDLDPSFQSTVVHALVDEILWHQQSRCQRIGLPFRPVGNGLFPFELAVVMNSVCYVLIFSWEKLVQDLVAELMHDGEIISSSLGLIITELFIYQDGVSIKAEIYLFIFAVIDADKISGRACHSCYISGYGEATVLNL